MTFLLWFLGKDYLIEALKYHLLKGEQKAHFKTPRTKPRQPVGLPKVSNTEFYLFPIVKMAKASDCRVHGSNPELNSYYLYLRQKTSA